MGFFNPWADIKRLQADLEIADREIAALRNLLKRAYFRDPKTGRMGKKGEIK